MNELHSLLKRQLRRFTGEKELFSGEHTDLFQSINDAYWQFDADRRMLEHSLELTSQELLERNAALSHINTELELRVAERTTSLRDSVNFIHALYQVAQSVITLENLPDVLQSVVNIVAETLAADRATLIIFDHEARQVTHVASAGPGVEPVMGTISYHEFMDGLSGWALRELRPAISPKGQLDPRESPVVQQRRIDTNCGSIVVLPLLYLGETLGTLTAINTPEQPDFTGQEVVWMETIANQAATAIGRAQIYDQLKKANLLLEQQRQRLQAERDLLQALMDNIPDLIYFKDTASRFTRINRAQARFLGVVTPEQAIGKTDLDFQNSDLTRSFYEEEQRLVQTGEPVVNRIEFNPTPDGQARWLSTTKVPIKDEAGRVISMVGVSHDITQRMQVEAKLEQSETLLRALFDLSPDAVLVIDPHDPHVSWPIIDCNIAACLMNGYRREELIGHSIDILNLTPGTEAERIAYMKQLRETVNLKLEADHRHKNGVVFPVEVSTTLITVGERELVIGIDRDITERKRIEDALREAEIKYRTLVEHMPAIIYVDLAGESRNTVYISPQVQEMLGYSPEDWMTQPDLCNNIVHPEDSERMWKEAQESEAYGRFSCDYRYIAKDGRVVWVHDEAVLLKNEAGEPSVWQGVMLDITAQKKAEEALRQSEERFRLMSWATKDAVWDWDLRTNQIWWGEGLQKMFHYSAETLQTDSEWWRAHIHPEDRGKVDRTISQALEGGMEFWSKEYRFQRVDGSYANIMDRGYILRKNIGEPYRMIGAMMDITERKQAEQALLDSEARYRQIVETAGDIIYRADTRGRLTYVNPTALHIMGYSTEAEVLGRHYLEFVHPAWRNRIRNTYNRQFVEKTLNTYQEFVVLTRAREEIWLGQTVQLVMESGRVTGFQAIARDITQRRQAEETVHRQNRMLSRLHQITLGLLKHHDIDRLLNSLVELSAELLEAPYAEIMLVEGEALVVKAVTQNQLLLLGKRLERKDALLSWQAFDTRRPAVLADYATWPNRQKDYEGFLLHAVADFPILNDDQCLGVLALGRDIAGYEFDPDQIQFGLLFASLTAIVINNAQLREALREQSIRDPLTGLFNRRYMEETLKREISRVTRQLHPLGIIMLDIDHFKRFNDTFGHVAGDAILRKLGQFLQSHIRVEDVACRYGGEEFILIMPDASLEVAQKRAEYLRREVSGLHVEEGGLSYGGITLSLGVAIYPQHGRTIEAVLLAADDALYRAKKEGRNRVMIAEDAR